MPRLLIALYLLTQVQGQSALRLYPVDDTARDPSFRGFVKKLRSAVEAHNTAALRKLVDSEVVVGPAAEDTGWAKFYARWRPDDDSSELWTALSDLLSLGFVREHPSLFVSPYLVWRFPHDLNRATHLVVTRDKVALRTAPSLRAPLAGFVSFEIVEQLGPPEKGEGLGEWVRVSTTGGAIGYLNARDVMSPMMPRAQFGTRRGGWALIALEAQDR
ncbi:MAG: SH3 domain-containing protein [Bryobacteraceae bacterium]